MTRESAFLLLVISCGGGGGHQAPDAPKQADALRATASQVVAAEGDFTAGDPGILSSVQTTSPFAAMTNLSPGAVGDDPVARVDAAAGFVYVVNRSDTDNVTQLDSATLNARLQLDTGSGTNPQDIAVVGSKWYVATFESTGLEVVDTSAGSAFTPIDLNAGSAVPNCNSVIAVGTSVLVSCELLDASFEPTGNGLVAVVDTSTDAVAASFDLQHPNPFGLFESLPDGNVAIPTIDFASGSGCLEEVDVGSDQSAGCIVDNAALSALTGSGSYASRFAITADAKTMMIVSASPDPGGPAALVPYDLATATLGSPISPTGEVIGDVTTCPNGEVVVADTGSGNGLRVYSTTAELTTEAINVGLKPASGHGVVCY